MSGTALSWFKSYLNLRTQSVLVNGKTSSEIILGCGVPQGSILGPILFTVYTSPLGEILRKYNMFYHLYADDCQLYLSFSPTVGNENNAYRTMENAIAEIKQWMWLNKLQLNDGKTEFLIIGKKSQCNKLTKQNIKICESDIQSSQSARNLGVIFDDELNMNKYVNNVSKTTFYHLRNIRRIRKCLHHDAAISLGHSLISSRLDYSYCNSLLYGVSKINLRKLQKVQNDAARLIIGTKN